MPPDESGELLPPYHSGSETRQASQDVAALPKEDEDREEADTMSLVQALVNQLLQCPPILLLLDTAATVGASVLHC